MNAAIKRMRSLAALELLNIPLWSLAWFGVLDFPLSPANLAGFGVFAVLLVQGSAYWTLKVKQLRRRQARVAGLSLFRLLRFVNLPLLAAALAVTVAQSLTAPGRSSWLGLGLALFGTLEYVNYFHVQLMYDTRADLRRLFSTGFRRSHLARDLSSATPRQQRRLLDLAEDPCPAQCRKPPADNTERDKDHLARSP
jgi:hypothetical protein